MKPVKRDKTFEKHFKKRIIPHGKLTRQFEDRFIRFVTNEKGTPLNDHELSGKLAGKRAFSITGDIRVVYVELENAYVFLNIGTHNQVYGR
jgi:mRNA-degrading endonuclease YafQ of YafQ-DinJ toxin-antitoxin module